MNFLSTIILLSSSRDSKQALSQKGPFLVPLRLITSDAEPVLPHAAETAERLEGMADQLNPNRAIDSI